MPDQMYLVITLRKPVPDRETAREISIVVKERLADRPDIQINAHATNHFDLDQPE